jgi:polyhydroxyalkanoate synthesis regulator phasin
MADADLILEKEWTNVIRNLRLGTEDGDQSDIKMYDRSGTNRVHVSASGEADASARVAIEGESGLLELGNDDFAGSFKLQPGDGDPAIEMTANPLISIGSGQESTTISDRDLFTHLVNADLITVSDELSAQTGRIQAVEVGGLDPGESYNKPGVLTAVDDQNTETVKIDGQNGTIKHSGGVSKLSDARVKHNVDSVDSALDTVDRLDGVSYEWDDDGVDDLNLDDDRHVGFLAQDVAEVLPEAVTEDDAGRLGTVDEAFTPVLVEAIKEQQALIDEREDDLDRQQQRIDDQQARLDAQQDRIADQRDRIEALEARLDAIESAS